MEIELKYLTNDENIFTKLMEDNEIHCLRGDRPIKEIPMNALYYDCADMRLMDAGFACRIRKEGDGYVATLKWKGCDKEGLFVRQELNVPLSEDEAVPSKLMEAFKEATIYEELVKLVGSEPLVEIMAMEFLRKQVKLDSGKSISVLSYDRGFINSKGKKKTISEVELELYSGDQKDMEAIGEGIKSRFNMEIGEKSKFKQGLDI